MYPEDITLSCFLDPETNIEPETRELEKPFLSLKAS